MKRPSKWWLQALIPAIPIALAWYALSSASVDNTERIARAMLFRPDGNFDGRTFAAAIDARFPKGTKPDALIAFAKAFKGECGPVKNGKLHCSFVQSGTFCVANKIGLVAELDAAGAIESIKSNQHGIGC